MINLLETQIETKAEHSELSRLHRHTHEIHSEKYQANYQEEHVLNALAH